MFSKGRYMKKCQHFFHQNDNRNADVKAMTIPWVFSKNSQGKNVFYANC